MTKEKFFLGYPVFFNEKIEVYPPSINDIVQKDDFFEGANFLIVSQEDIEDEYVKKDIPLEEMPTPFEYLLSAAYSDEGSYNLIQKAFKQFIHSEVCFLFQLKKIAIGSKEEIIAKADNVNSIIFLEEDEYFDFQNLIRETLGITKVEPYNPDEHPKIRAMKAKARYRDKVKAKRNGLSLFATLSSICCMGIGLNPLNIGELSYVAAQELVSRFSQREKFDIDLHTIWAGADQKKHKITPIHWIRDLDKD